jgi:hypothetical protein
MDQVRDAAAITCGKYPVKKRFMQSMASRIVQRKSGREVIAYGSLAAEDSEREFVETVPDTATDVRWELALGTGLPGPCPSRHAADAPARHVRAGAVSTPAPWSSVS